MLTERFQILIAGAEIGNGYSELNNPIEQRARFEEQQKLLEAGDSEAMMPDWEFVEMLEHGMPPTCGFGFGERLFTFFVNSTIRETTLFPLMKPMETHLTKKNNTAVFLKEKIEKELVIKKIKLKDLGLSHGEATSLLEANTEDKVTKLHMIETEAIMRSLATKFGEDPEAWGIIGLLHDIDWDQTKNDIKNHTINAVDILRRAGGTEILINTIESHCYGNLGCGQHPTKSRSTKIEHSLVAAETITGLIIASALMQPDKKLSSVKLSSLKKKFKSKSFAANCNRDMIREIEKTGLSLDDFFDLSLKSLQKISDKLGL